LFLQSIGPVHLRYLAMSIAIRELCMHLLGPLKHSS